MLDMTQNVHRVVVLPGDGIGVEVTAAAVQVMGVAAERHGVRLALEEHACGAFHYRETGEAISGAALAAVGSADAVLFGAAGWPEIRDRLGVEIAPQIDLREQFQLFAGLRPVRLYAGVPGRWRGAGWICW